MMQVLGFECTVCGKLYGCGEALYVCPDHGNEGTLDVRYDYDRVATMISPALLACNLERSMWRYLPLLPVSAEAARARVSGTVLETVGWTPMIDAPRLADPLGLAHLWVKDDGRQPTASFKDRASAVAVLKARELGFSTVTTASTGNAAAALAGLCAAISLPNVIFVPRLAPQAKIAQLLVYGAKVLLVDGSYDDAFDLCLKAAAEFGWYNRNTGYNPLMTEGKKTAAYEMCEQLQWQVPDAILIPAGDGSILGGIRKGLCDLMALGWIGRMPRLIGVQAAGSAALAQAWSQGADPLQMEPIDARTVADSICAGLPRDRIKALRAVHETQGAFVTVTDDEIVAAIPALARGCGVFAEPAAAAAYAGLIKAAAAGLLSAGETAVVLATGSGLKDIGTAIRSLVSPPVISANLEAVRTALHL